MADIYRRANPERLVGTGYRQNFSKSYKSLSKRHHGLLLSTGDYIRTVHAGPWEKLLRT